ncbi:hypothetical protein WDU94_011409 [Cyamophila willieti]
MFSGTTRQFIAASLASIGVFTVGMSFAWSAPILDELLSKDSPIPMTSKEGSWLVAIIELGNYMSPIPGAYAVDTIGRKWTFLATGPVTALSYIIAMYTRSVPGLYIVRCLQGMSMSVIFMVAPMYLGEIAEVRIRGSIGTVFQISLHLGILFTYVLGSELSYMNYQIYSLIVPIIFMATFVFMPESPYYYVSKNQDEKAIESLKWLRNKSRDQVEKELQTIKENSSKPTERTNFKQFMGRANMNALMLSFFLILFRQFTGVQSLIAFANTVFASSVSFLSPDHITILFAVILLVSIFPATYFIDKSGRRILMLISSGGCALSSFVAGIYYYLTIQLAYEIPYTSWVPFVSLSLLGVFFNIGFGSLLTPLLSEFFASGVKAADMTVCGMTGTTLGLASYKLFYYLNEDVGVYSNFIFGGVLCTISTIYLYVFLFETKGKTFNEIQMMFKYGENWKDPKQSMGISSASAALNTNNDLENGGIPLTDMKC